LNIHFIVILNLVIVILSLVIVILNLAIVILNLFQDNAQLSPVILKQVQDDEIGGAVQGNETGPSRFRVTKWGAAPLHPEPVDGHKNTNYPFNRRRPAPYRSNDLH